MQSSLFLPGLMRHLQVPGSSQPEATHMLQDVLHMRHPSAEPQLEAREELGDEQMQSAAPLTQQPPPIRASEPRSAVSGQG